MTTIHQFRFWRILAVMSGFLFLFTSMTCDDEPNFQSVTISNQSDEIIFIYADEYEEGTPVLKPSDCLNSDSQLYHWEAIKANTEKKMEYFIINLDTAKPESQYQFLVISQSTFEAYDRDQIVSENISDALILVTYQELSHNSFTLKYPAE